MLLLRKLAVFESKEMLDSVLPLPSKVKIGEPTKSEDGRVAIRHTFTEGDLEYLVTGGAEIRETILEDWQYPEVEPN